MTTSQLEALPEGHPASREEKTTEAAATAPAKASRNRPRAKAARGSPSPKKGKRAKQPKGARKGSKTARVLALLQRANRASLPELIRATDWQPHSVRGLLSGTVGGNLGLSVASVKDPNGTRRYSVKS